MRGFHKLHFFQILASLDNNVLYIGTTYFITLPPSNLYQLHFKCSFFLFLQAIRQEFVIPKNPGTKNKHEEPEELISRPTKDNHLKEASTTATTLAESKQPENHSSER